MRRLHCCSLALCTCVSTHWLVLAWGSQLIMWGPVSLNMSCARLFVLCAVPIQKMMSAVSAGGVSVRRMSGIVRVRRRSVASAGAGMLMHYGFSSVRDGETVLTQQVHVYLLHEHFCRCTEQHLPNPY